MNIDELSLMQDKIDELVYDKADLFSMYCKIQEENDELKEKLEIALSAIEAIKKFNLSKLKKLQIDSYLKKINQL